MPAGDPRIGEVWYLTASRRQDTTLPFSVRIVGLHTKIGIREYQTHVEYRDVIHTPGCENKNHSNHLGDFLYLYSPRLPQDLPAPTQWERLLSDDFCPWT